MIDVDACAAESFVLTDRIAAGTVSPWHEHRRDQLLYASSGTLVLEVAAAEWWLPSQRAAFLAAGVRHRIRCRGGAELCTAYLRADVAGLPGCGVFSVLPVAREMIRYGARWGPARDPGDELATVYFEALAKLCADWRKDDVGLRLPVPRSVELRRAFDHALEQLAATNMEQAARVAGVSVRTLSRRFAEETGISWRQFLRTARVLRAMEELTRVGARVTEVAFSVGFEDVTAFSRAFKTLAGELPSDYQRRVAG